MKKHRLLAILLAFSMFSAYAQKKGYSNSKDHNTVDLSRGRTPNCWFVSGGVGANLYIGKYNEDFTKHFTPAIDLSFGKWITPRLGLRLQYNGISMKATTDNTYWYSPIYQEHISELKFSEITFDYHAIHTDVLINLSAIGKDEYNPNKMYRCVAVLGWGWSYSSIGQGKNRNELFAILGLKNNFRISPAIDIHAELRATIVSQRLAGHMIGGQAAYPVAATVGVTYHFNKRRTKNNGSSLVSGYPVAVYEDVIRELKSENQRLKQQNMKLVKSRKN